MIILDHFRNLILLKGCMNELVDCTGTLDCLCLKKKKKFLCSASSLVKLPLAFDEL